MKKSLYLLLILIATFLPGIKAQEPVFIPDTDSIDIVSDQIPIIRNDSASVSRRVAKRDSIPLPDMYAWKIDPRSGDRIYVNLDDSLLNFHRQSLMDGQSLAMSYLGNLGSPAQSKLFFDREEGSLFPFLDAFGYYQRTAAKQRFLNTKIPYSNIFYQTAGSKINSEERFNAQLSSNFGKKLNIGFDLDYVYSRGFYSYLANKQITYDFYASYVSGRYQMHAFARNNNYNNSENGGIQNDQYITDPNAVNEFKGDSKEIPVNVYHLWNRLKGRQLFISNRYNLGYEEGEESDEKKDFIPVASFTLTTQYEDQQRRFASRDERAINQNYTETDIFLGYNELEDRLNIFYSNDIGNNPASDQMAYWSLKNTFAISLNEGFKEWVKFGLTAFIEQDFRKFSLPMVVRTTANGPELMPMVVDFKNQNSTVIGGMLTKQKGRFLRYNLKADLALLGSDIGEFRLMGDATTTIKFAGKDASVKLSGYIKNIRPEFFQNNLRTKYTYWNKDLNDTRRVFASGEITIPQTGTKLTGAIENIQNFIYYDRNKTIAQESQNLQVIALQAEQRLKAGIFHWDNRVAYQISSEKEALPLPQLSVYSNIYLLTKLAKVLTLQLGVDAQFHTKYYASGYDPSLLQFYNQQNTKTGGFPLSTAYLNLHLKKSRFFIMMYNVAKDIGEPNYFSLPHYPVNPMVMKMGISWDFSD
ncbi:putative porin [Viscerimonas tarda]